MTTHKFQVPKGAKISKVNLIDGYIEYRISEPKWKTGDVLYSQEHDYNFLMIYKDKSSLVGGYFNYFALLNIDFDRLEFNSYCDDSNWQLATDEQKELLFSKMREKGKDFVGGELVDYVWTPKNGEEYYYIDNTLRTQEAFWEGAYQFELRLLENYNYFKTKELAEKASVKIKAVLKACKHH